MRVPVKIFTFPSRRPRAHDTAMPTSGAHAPCDRRGCKRLTAAPLGRLRDQGRAAAFGSACRLRPGGNRHKLTQFAQAEGPRIIYPPEQPMLL
jgi:hypothetical protein